MMPLNEISSTLVERLSSASVEFVVVAIAVAAMVHIGRIRSKRIVSLLWLVVLVKPLLSLAIGSPAPLIPIQRPGTAVVQSNTAPTAEATGTVVSPPALAEGQVTREAGRKETVSGATSNSGTEGFPRAGAAIWIAGVIAMLMLSVADRLRVRRLVAAATRPSKQLQSIYDALGEGRRPRLLVTRHLESPALVGTLRPVIFLPHWMVHQNNVERVEWSLRHEIAHWALRDPWANLVREVVQIVFFFHPLAWWVGSRWKVSAEAACDEHVVSTTTDARRYAEQLYQILAHVHQQKRLALSSGLFATRTQIGRRIENLLNSPPRATRRVGAAGLVLLAVFAAAAFSMGTEFVDRGVTVAERQTKSVHEKMRGWEGSLHEKNDEREIKMKAKGDFSISENYDILEIGPGGYFILEEKTPLIKRYIKIKGKKGGELQIDYRIDGKKSAFDDGARKWVREYLREHLSTDKDRGAEEGHRI